MVFKIARKIIFTVCLFFLLLLQFSLVSALPSWLAAINLPLFAVFLTLLFGGIESTVFVAIFFGFFLDAWHFGSFGVHLFSLIAVSLLANFLAANWLTNRSLYSFLALSAFMAFSYNLLLGFFSFVFSLEEEGIFFLANYYFWLDCWWTLFWLTILSAVSFIVLSLTSRHLKPFFLKKN